MSEMPLTAIILAGGKSRRMGTDKALLPYKGVSMLEHIVRQLRPHCGEILVSAAFPGQYEAPGVHVVADEVLGEGPLRGIASCLVASRNDVNFVIACDSPEVDVPLMKALVQAVSGHDCATPRRENGNHEPLFAAYRKTALPRMQELLEAGTRTVHALLDVCDTVSVPAASNGIVNVNTPADYEALRNAHAAPCPQQ